MYLETNMVSGVTFKVNVFFKLKYHFDHDIEYISNFL